MGLREANELGPKSGLDQKRRGPPNLPKRCNSHADVIKRVGIQRPAPVSAKVRSTPSQAMIGYPRYSGCTMLSFAGHDPS